MKTNYHTHTTRCHHATGSDEEFVLSAIKGGYQELGFSDHTPWKYHTDYISDIRMLPEELPGYVESIRSLQEKYKNQISIKIGLECEYFPEYIHWLKGIIKEYKLDYIIFGNHHFHTDEKFPYFGRNTDSVASTMFVFPISIARIIPHVPHFCFYSAATNFAFGAGTNFAFVKAAPTAPVTKVEETHSAMAFMPTKAQTNRKTFFPGASVSR